ncbi:cytochrome P450 [Halalkalibacterium halodurans]|jgi:cytochrome P450|uniref:Cytochrome P450 n=2 Tax=Halalkalibacterium halodurans TaxID=86665 RepID=A0A0M0KD65_ALKHA|nr:cytochrome P450 [Halalkalibacterium halodurans]TPE69370.1 cytochrome P450 [Halalkalibacterium halodurans]
MPTNTMPTGPKGNPVLGNTIEFGKDPLQFITRCSQEYGEIVRLRFERERDTFLLNDPKHIQYVFMNKGGEFSKGYQQDPIMGLVFGNGLLTSEGSFWLRQRRLSQPAFHPKRIADYADTMVGYCERMLNTWMDNDTRDINDEMMQLTMAIATKTLFDLDLHKGDTKEASRSLDTVMTAFNEQMTNVFRHVLHLIGLGKLVPPVSRELREAVESLDKMIYSIIEERRKHPGDRGDLLSMLISTYDEDDGSYMTDRQLRDEIITLFLAGHETTANTLSWAFYLLSQHPHVEEKLYQEVSKVLGNRPATLEDMPKLSYAEHVIKETLRVQPTVWLISRRAEKDVTLGDYHISAGSEIMISQWGMHRNPRYFNDPLTFLPERWDNNDNKPSKYVYFPFGGGPRVCIGERFAMMEATLIMATIIREFRMELVDELPIKMEPSITLRPKHGVTMKLRKR